MSGFIAQERSVSQQATASSLSLAFASAVTGGDSFHTIGSAGITTTTTYSFSDGTNSYSTARQKDDAGNGQSVGHSVAQNVASGTPTVQVAFGSNVGFLGLAIRDIGGVKAASLDGINEAISAGSTISVAATNANQPAFQSSFCQNDSTTSTPAATNGTQDVTLFDFGLGGGNFAVTSHNRFTTTGSQSASFSATGATGLLALTAIFDETVAAAPQRLTQFQPPTRVEEPILIQGGPQPSLFQFRGYAPAPPPSVNRLGYFRLPVLIDDPILIQGGPQPSLHQFRNFPVVANPIAVMLVPVYRPLYS